jgi:hypothetical protein
MIAPRKVDKPLVLYGYGRLGHLAEEIFIELGIPILTVIERAQIDIRWLFKIPKDGCLLAISVATEPYEKVIAPLKEAGWKNIVPVWDILEYYADRTGIRNGWFTNELTPDYFAGISTVTSLLKGDDVSANSYLCFVIWHQVREEFLSIQEVSPCEFLPSTLADIRRRQRVDMFADSPMKHIDIHNEGCELKTLEENIHLLQKYRPPLSVACYHSRDGLWKIEKFCMDNLPDYTWTFRLHAYQGQAAYLYGTPNERRKK